ncbi:MAG TPA: 6-carboxytetrahydropterin synthase [Candidatus Bathyarchaeia archaeon]|nr:6-carboxytetrahydropterin synthase [Candidatus Bathyarchaeia archaeon]
MYAVAIKRDFVAQHHLAGGDWGEENSNHSHHYKVELQLEGEELDCHGFLVDIVDLEAQLGALVRYYVNRTLNELPEFAGLNPSIERFAFILCDALSARIDTPAELIITVKIWENDNAWASHSRVKQRST